MRKSSILDMMEQTYCLTVKERILLHMLRFPSVYPKQNFDVPRELTQDGIASAAGISRAHVSIDLKKLEEYGFVERWQAHLNGTPAKRFVYCLTPIGAGEGRKLMANLEKKGIDTDMLLDIGRCNPEGKWKCMSQADRDAVGRACVFRKPVLKKDLPGMTSGTIPTDFRGYICIPERTAEAFIRLADPFSLRSWHSWAADYWLKSGNRAERLYHLNKAGRNIEANILAETMD